MIPEPYDVSTVADPALKTKLSESVQNGNIPILCEGKVSCRNQPRHVKTNVLHMQKQRRGSASQ